MRLRKSWMFVGLSLLTIGLAGCQSSAQKSDTSFKTSSSQSSHYSAKKPDAAVSSSSSSKEAQTYQPKTDQTRSASYVKSGNLKSSGQFTFDKVGTKLQLDQVKHPKTTIKSGQLTYKITTVRILKNTAETTAAKRMAAQALNLTTISSPYYTIQVKFTITNRGKQAVTTDGIKGLRLKKNLTLNASNQLSDASAGKSIPANGKLNSFATGLASQKKAPTFKSVKIAFSGAYANQKQVVSPTSWLTVSL